jgi:hypothetical protein
MRGSTRRLPATLTSGWEQLIGVTLEDGIIVSCAQINTVSYTAFVLLNVAAASRGKRKFGNTAGAIG